MSRLHIITLRLLCAASFVMSIVHIGYGYWDVATFFLVLGIWLGDAA